MGTHATLPDLPPMMAKANVFFARIKVEFAGRKGSFVNFVCSRILALLDVNVVRTNLQELLVRHVTVRRTQVSAKAARGSAGRACQ